ncbi:MAG TPA: glycosyltransferase family 2 protein [Chitinophagaceae bacterium]|nr:glycosyltransferase family 2 protein [Chitinophagaceae bacterium]
MDCSIILVNYKSAKLLADCLQTVYAQTSRISFEVIVVDNHSQDSGKELITRTFPQVRWIQMDYNAGFARANNAGIKAATGSAVLLLNADTLIKNNAIENCYFSLMQSPCAAAGVQLLNADGSPQISGNYAMRGGLNYLLPLPYVGAFIKSLGNMFKVARPNVPDTNETIEVDWINGAFLMVKKNAIEQAGLLDEDFFLYAEEAEWCSRLKKQGSLCIFGREKVIHLQGETANATFASQGKGYYNLYDRKGLQIMLSNFVRIRKEFGLGWFLFHLVAYSFTILVFVPALLLDKLFNGKRSAHSWKQLKQYAVNIKNLLRFTPAIIANKPYFYKVL